MPKKGKQSSIKSSEYSVGYSEGAGPKSTTRPGEQRDQKKRRAGSGTAPGKRKRLLKPGYYEAVVSAAKLTLTPTGDREITVDLYVPHASGKRFEVATGADYRKFCQAAATEEQQWMHLTRPKLSELAPDALLSSTLQTTDARTRQTL